MSTSVPQAISRPTQIGQRVGRNPGQRPDPEQQRQPKRQRGPLARLRLRGAEATMFETAESPRPNAAWVVLWGFFCISIVAQTVVLSDGAVGRLKPLHLAAAACTVAAVFLPHRWRRFNPATTVFWLLAIGWASLMAFVSWRNSLDQQGLQQLLLVLLAIGPALVYRYIVETGSRGQLMVLQCAPLLGVVGLGWTIQANSHRTGVRVIDGVMAVLRGNPNYITNVFYRRGLILPGNVEIVRGNLRHLVFIALAGSVWTAVYAVAVARKRGIQLPSWLTAVSVGMAAILTATSTSRSSLLILVLPLIAMAGRLFVVQRTTLGGNKVMAAAVVVGALVMMLLSSFLEGSVIGRIFSDTDSYRQRIAALGEAMVAATKSSWLAPAPPFPSPHNLILGTIGFYGWVAGVVSIAMVATILWGFARAERDYLRDGRMIHIAVAGFYSAAAVRSFTAGDNGLPLIAIVGVLIGTLVVAPATPSAAVADPDVLARRTREAARAQREARAGSTITPAHARHGGADGLADTDIGHDQNRDDADRDDAVRDHQARDHQARDHDGRDHGSTVGEHDADTGTGARTGTRGRSRTASTPNPRSTRSVPPTRRLPRRPAKPTEPPRPAVRPAAVRGSAVRDATPARSPRPPLRPERPSRTPRRPTNR